MNVITNRRWTGKLLFWVIILSLLCIVARTRYLKERSEPLAFSPEDSTGYYSSLTDRGLFGKRFYKVHVDGKNGPITISINGVGYSPFTAYYQNQNIREQGTCWVAFPEAYNGQPAPNLNNVWSLVCYLPDGTEGSRVYNGNGIKTSYYKSGSKQSELEFVKGAWKRSTEWYETGKISEIRYFRGYDSHGDFTSYYPNGKIKTSGHFNYSFRSGNWITYSEKGHVIEKIVYEKGRVIKKK